MPVIGSVQPLLDRIKRRRVKYIAVPIRMMLAVG
jgi:hypothetical protein